MKQLYTLCLLLVLTSHLPSQSITNSTINAAFLDSKSGSLQATSSIAEATLIETFKGNNLVLTQGYLQVELKNGSSVLAVNTEKTITVFPNPSADIFNLSLDGFPKSEMLIQVFDLSGKKIKTLPIDLKSNADKIQINLQDYAAATYICTIEPVENPNDKQLLKLYKK